MVGSVSTVGSRVNIKLSLFGGNYRCIDTHLPRYRLKEILVIQRSSLPLLLLEHQIRILKNFKKSFISGTGKWVTTAMIIYTDIGIDIPTTTTTITTHALVNLG